jgi:hypothetical protein
MRIVLAALLSLLLLGLQHETLVHPLQHDRARLANGGKAVAQSSAEGLCATCALISGSTDGAAAQAGDTLQSMQGLPASGFHRSSFVALAPVYYASRAPPVLSV